MLGLELCEVRLVLLELGRFPVLSEIGLVLVFQCLRLRFERLLFMGRKALPVLANQLRNFSESQIAPLEVLAHFFKSCNQSANQFTRFLGLELPSHLLLEKRT